MQWHILSTHLFIFISCPFFISSVWPTFFFFKFVWPHAADCINYHYICVTWMVIIFYPLQVWQMRTGSRLLTIPCPKGSKMLQPTYRFSLASSSSSSSYVPLEVFILNGDSGQISVLNRFLHWANYSIYQSLLVLYTKLSYVECQIQFFFYHCFFLFFCEE